MTSSSAVFTAKTAQNRQLPFDIFTVRKIGKQLLKATENSSENLLGVQIHWLLAVSWSTWYVLLNIIYFNLITFVKSFKHTKMSNFF